MATTVGMAGVAGTILAAYAGLLGDAYLPFLLAGAILFLLSNLSSYVTGQTLLVDGGLDLKWSHLGPDNTSLFLKDESFRNSITAL